MLDQINISDQKTGHAALQRVVSNVVCTVPLRAREHAATV